MSTTEAAQATETVLRRVRGLLDQAESTPFEEEQATFTAKANEMMARYRIDRAMLEAARPAQDRGKIIERDINLGSGPYVRTRLALLHRVGKATNCRVLTSVGWEGRIGTVYGYEADVETVEMLYTSLLLQATIAMKREQVPSGTKALQFRRGFLMGFAHRTGERLKEVNRAAVSDADNNDGSVALVLVDRKDDVDKYIDNRFGKLRSLSASAPVAGSGRVAGMAAGNRADIGGRKVSGQRELS